ncbi:MAG: SUMF1/EgtB/PvdO family nonheme iron enzyme, partial [Myxococcales bacterium]|nr:SUMF1/EgtB/PvdO family nonheme iron enzyme [Myxococcales bacterium]
CGSVQVPVFVVDYPRFVTPNGDGFIARYYTEHETFGEYPALGVSHEDAIKYCTFRGGRLPTEAEWEFVATSRGARDRVWEDPSLDALLLDGCENSDQRDAVAVGACGSRVRPVMSSTADRTAQGVHDLAGNAREWTADEYDPLAYCDAQQPGGPLTDVFTWSAGKPLPAATRSLLTAAASADTCIDLDPESAVGRYEGACIDDFGRCTAVCGPVFDVAPELRRQRWAKYACAARAGFNPGTVDDPAFPACDAEECGENCQQYCNCQQNPPPLPTDSGDCLQACDAVAETCMGVCTVPGLAFNCVQFETGRNCLPTPWCKPREGASGSEPHLRPSAFDAGIEGAWTVRGGHFQLGNDRPEDICQAAPSSRRGQQTADALTGFRCAYDKGTPRCP